MRSKWVSLTAAAAALIFVAFVIAAAYFLYIPKKCLGLAEVYSEKFSVDKALVLAVMRAESRFDEDAVSEKGAVGLMQVLPSTAEFISGERVSGEKLLDPDFNVGTGAAYLSYLFGRFSCEQTVVAAYNAGEGRVAKWLEDPALSSDGRTLDVIPFAETSAYVRRVLAYKRIYKKILKIK